VNYIKTNDNRWTVIIESQSHTFDATHPNFIGLVECVKTNDVEEFQELISIGVTIQDWSEGKFEFRDGFLYYEDEQVADQPTTRIIELIKNGWDHKPMLAYLDRLYNNVSNRAVMESYNWCSHKGLPLTPDGYLVGYKGVSVYHGENTTDKMGRPLQDGDLVDKYTGKSFRNNPADDCGMNRRKVSDDCTQGCGQGLHVGTYDYACSWAGSGGKVILVRFDPADIVSVPSDCEHQKMRVSNYTVLSVARDIIEEDVYDEYEVEDAFDDEGRLISEDF